MTEASALVPMQAASFASEDDFQDLLARFPALLAGDQIDSVNPRRFMLVDREQPIACEPGGAGRWSLDHLFLDQDGVPTLVEVKRGTDTRIRREVVGQMLDYAANAILHWPADELRERFTVRCEAAGKSATEVLLEQFGPDQDFDAFWGKVKANLLAGRIRMLFVADRIPPELRKVVEFLNVQMRPAEVLAVELRQYQGQGLRTLCRSCWVRPRKRLMRNQALQAPNRDAYGTRPDFLRRLRATPIPKSERPRMRSLPGSRRGPIAPCSMTRRALDRSDLNLRRVMRLACPCAFGPTAAYPSASIS